MNGSVYLASEDSALLRKVLGGYSGGKSLEIGAGNAGNLFDLAKSHGLAVGSDIVKPEMRDWVDAGAEFVLADKASCFIDKVFDLVAFNPPYLPSEAVTDPAVDDGGEGRVPVAFLREALRVVKDSGTVLMLVGEENPLRVFNEECAKRGFAMRKVFEKHLFYERLSVYEAGRKAESADC